VRSILDGHIVLSRRLAAAGHYPAIDVMHSLSRLSTRISEAADLDAAKKIREALAVYDESKDLIELGAYVSGSNPRLDAAVRLRPEINAFLRQDTGASRLPETLLRMRSIAERL
jgi:flagellum-specific ATP synthase/type III secretion protein N (ATPase)